MNQEFRADLHCHSTYSDGTCEPEELIQQALQIGLKGISITDHDTIDAYQHIYPLKHPIKIIPGVEFSTVFEKQSIHVLGYSFQLFHPAVSALCKRHALRRHERNLAILELLKKQQMPVSEKDMEQEAGGHGTVGRPHIALAMIKKGYVRSVEEAFKRYLKEGKPCYVPGQPITIEETLQTIHEAKGYAVLAHPHLIQKQRIIPKLLSLPLDGIECYYANFPKKSVKTWISIAEQRGLLVTGGSDFHGTIKPKISLGCSWTPSVGFNVLFSRHLENNS